MQTSKFQGAKLREAREARGLTQSALSDLSRIAAARISHYEHERHQPDTETISNLADTLNLPLHYFFRLPRQNIGQRKVFWRSKLSAKATERTRVARRFDWLVETYLFLDQNIQFPAPSFPSLYTPDNLDAITDEFIEKSADSLRSHWGLGRGPITNIVSCMESNGVVTSIQSMNDDYLDAFSEWNVSLQRPIVFLGANKISYARRLFSAAHELGHMLMHRRIPIEAYQTKATLKQLEHQANYFASCFLLPSETFSADLYSLSLDALLSLKHSWQVSVSAMIMRLHQLDIFDDDGKRKAFIQMSRRKWNRHEPGDEPTTHDQPRMTENAFEILLESGKFTPDSIEREIGLSTEDIESVTGLTPGKLRVEPVNPYKLRLAT